MAVTVALSFAALTGTGLIEPAIAGATPPGPASFITFTSSPPTVSASSTQVWGVIGSTYAPAATATSGDPVALTIDASSTAGACSLSAGTVTFAAPGACVIDAGDPGNGSYSAAAEEQQSIDVNYGPSCETLAFQQPGLADGDYTLDVAGVATTIYCASMGTAPADYLDLAAGPSVNFSQLGGNWAYSGTGAVSTSYSKIRFYPATLQVWNGDTTFAASTSSNGEHGANAVGWGVASACSQPASFEVDLEGTPFAFAHGMNGFGAAGSSYNGAPMVSRDTTEQAYSDTGVNGYCGHAGVHSPNLQVAGYPGLWGSPVDGSASFKVLLSQVDGSGQPTAGQPLSFVQTVGSALAQGTVPTTLGGAASGAAPTYRAAGGNCSVDQTGLVTLLAAGSCTTSWAATSEDAAGDVQVRTLYSGNTDFLTSTSSSADQMVGAAGTATSVSATVSPTVSGQSTEFDATLWVADPGSDANVAPTGTVKFQQSADGTNWTDIADCGTVTVDWSASTHQGTSSCLTSLAAVDGSSGQVYVQAVYSGDSNFQTLTSSPADQSVGTAATSAALSSTLASALSGQSTEFDATVSLVSPGTDVHGAPTGTVQFQESTDSGADWSTVAGCQAQALTWDGALHQGTASCVTSQQSAVRPSYLVQAVYGGDANFAGATSPSASVDMAPDATSTGVSSGAASAAPDREITFTAQVNAALPGAGTPTGTVTFTDGTSVLCASVPVVARAAQCEAQLPAQPAGQTVTATYSGNGSPARVVRLGGAVGPARLLAARRGRQCQGIRAGLQLRVDGRPPPRPVDDGHGRHL